MNSTIGTCKHCGQVHVIEAETQLTPDEAALEATGRCDCNQAQRDRGNARFETQIVDKLGAGSEDRGFRGPVDEEIVGLVRRCAPFVEGGHLAGVAIKLSQTETIKISLDKNDLLKLTRREVRER